MRSGVVRGVFVGRRLLFGGGVVKDGVVNAAPRVSLLRPHCSVQATVESARLLVPRLLEASESFALLSSNIWSPRVSNGKQKR